MLRRSVVLSDPEATKAIIEHGKNIPSESQFDIMLWVPEFILGVLISMAGALLWRSLKKIDQAEAAAVNNTNELYKYKVQTDATLAIHTAEISNAKQTLQEIKAEQKETNAKLTETNLNLQKLITITAKAYKIDE